MDKKLFSEKINRLCVAFGISSFSDERGKLYYEFLGDLNAEDFTIAVENIISSDNWFPSIARLLEITAVSTSPKTAAQVHAEVEALFE